MKLYILSEYDTPFTALENVIGEVIMCKDCKFWMQNPFREYPREFGLCFKHKDIAIASDETDWCCWAERKDNEID